MRDERGFDNSISDFGAGQPHESAVPASGHGRRAGAETDSLVFPPTSEGDAVSHVTPGMASPVIPVSVVVADHPPFHIGLMVGPLVVPITAETLSEMAHDAFRLQREAAARWFAAHPEKNT
ncbi:MAG TPA: hypothetical protein VH020_09225 [Stellaceae bacterium]|jgi:hypothetical protein|nr:hypothetical protein [Stellaceae bacterium]